MKKVCILTATRAEYGLLKPLIIKLKEENDIDARVVVTGAHLSPEFGLTYEEIEKDGIVIDKKIEMLLSSDSPSGISKSMGLAMIGFADYFQESKPDLLIVLGDRYEVLAVCSVAMNFQIPIAHLYGGETTEGAIDEAIRHAITKMSYLHFTSTEIYRKRVIQLGEDPKRVFNVGAMGVENAKMVPLLSFEGLSNELKIDLIKPFVVVTFHPVTLEKSTAKEQINELFNAIDNFPEINFFFTKSNSDSGGREINHLIDEYVKSRPNAEATFSLGMVRYLSAIKNAEFVIGNSSSGIVEVPSFGVPTINIGDRQKGRIQALSTINCEPISREIIHSIQKAISLEFKEFVVNIKNPYEKKGTSQIIVDSIKDFLSNDKIDIKKSFYNLQVKT